MNKNLLSPWGFYLVFALGRISGLIINYDRPFWQLVVVMFVGFFVCSYIAGFVQGLLKRKLGIA